MCGKSEKGNVIFVIHLATHLVSFHQCHTWQHHANILSGGTCWSLNNIHQTCRASRPQQQPWLQASVWRYPKCWMIPIPILFPVLNIFDTDTSTFFRYQIFPIPVPRLFFRYQIWLIPVPRLFSGTKYFRYRFRYHQNNEKFLVPVPMRYRYPL